MNKNKCNPIFQTLFGDKDKGEGGGGGGGGGDITVEVLSVTENGVYTAPSGTAYSPVSVAVPVPELDTLNVSENGSYSAPSGHAYDEVVVACPEPKAEDTLNVSQNGQYTPQSGHVYSEVNVNVSASRTDVPKKDFNFYDYDGTRLYSYTAAEVQAMSELPAAPTPPDSALAFAKWTNTLAELKASTTRMDIGAIYHVPASPGNYHNILCIEVAEQKTLWFRLTTASYDVVVNWGDGTSETINALQSQISVSHTFAPGRYKVDFNGQGHELLAPICRDKEAVDVEDTYFDLKWYAGGEQTQCDNSALRHQAGMQYIFYSFNNTLSFEGCSRLVCAWVTNCGTLAGSISLRYSQSGHYAGNLTGLYDIHGDCSIGNGSTTGGYALEEVDAYNSQNYISVSGTYVKRAKINLRANTGTYPSFSNCNYLESVEVTGFTGTSMGIFTNCGRLKAVTIPSTVTTIAAYGFRYCKALTELTFPAALTSIKNYAVEGCTGLQALHFLSATPPTVANANAWGTGNSKLPTTCKIYVPTGSLNAYKTATNYPDPTVYTYEEE